MTTPSRFTRAGMTTGLRYALPLLPGVAVFGATFGAVAAKTNFSLLEAIAMSTLVFAGASQMVALAAWQAEWTWATAAMAVLLVATVNSRLILMGATLYPWLAHLPPAKAYGVLAVNTDASWILAIRAEAETGARDVGVFLGAGLTLWVTWIVSTIPGWWAGAAIGDPRAFALDLVMVVFFAAMLVPLWKGTRKARPWAIAGVVALAVWWLVPGYLYIVVGTLAGALAGAFLDD